MNESAVTRFTGHDVRAIRSKAGMTQKQFCESFGFNINTLRHWEKGDRSPSGAALAILNLLDASPEVVQELRRGQAKRMESSEKKSILKTLVVNREEESLKDLLEKNPNDVEQIILALLHSIGFIYQKFEKKGDQIEFYAGHDSGNLRLVLCLNTPQSNISGECQAVLEKALAVVYAIENDLSSAIYLPHEMRQARIQAVIQDLEIDEAFYSTVLRNW